MVIFFDDRQILATLECIQLRSGSDIGRSSGLYKAPGVTVSDWSLTVAGGSAAVVI